jgi:proliferating cell nuclear antigen PCNA
MFKNKIFSCKTTHPIPLKLLVEVLQNVIPETTLIINGQDPEHPSNYGLEISTNDTSKTIFIRLQLNGSEFSQFHTKLLKYNIGLNLSDLNTIIFKTIDSSTTSIALSISESDKQNLNIDICDEKKLKNTNFKFKIMDLNYVYRKPITTEYDVIITMSNSEFHKICKEMSVMSDYVDIKCTEKQIIFTCVGDIASRESVYKVENGGISIEWKSDVKTKIVQAIFELKNIVLFNKCNTLCQNIIILMKNDYILSIIYEIASFGRLNVSFSPVKDEHIKNTNYDYSDNEDDLDDDIKLITSINEDLIIKKNKDSDLDSNKEVKKSKKTKK